MVQVLLHAITFPHSSSTPSVYTFHLALCHQNHPGSIDLAVQTYSGMRKRLLVLEQLSR